MLAGITQGIKQQAQPQQAPNDKWTTRRTQWSRPPSEISECCWATWCLPCAAAAAKSRADGTIPCMNFFCWTPCGAYNFVRQEYRIQGVCGDDMCYTTLCGCCNIRQLLTETRLRGLGPQSGNYGSNQKEWEVSLFDCSMCELCNTTLCWPCAAHKAYSNLQPAQDSCCFTFLCTYPCSWYGQVRHEYGIVTDFPICEDAFVPLFCFPCALNRAIKQSSKPMTRIAPPPQAGGAPAHAQHMGV